MSEPKKRKRAPSVKATALDNRVAIIDEIKAHPLAHGDSESWLRAVVGNPLHFYATQGREAGLRVDGAVILDVSRLPYGIMWDSVTHPVEGMISGSTWDAGRWYGLRVFLRSPQLDAQRQERRAFDVVYSHRTGRHFLREMEGGTPLATPAPLGELVEPRAPPRSTGCDHNADHIMRGGIFHCGKCGKPHDPSEVNP